MSRLAGQRIVLGISAGIAAYKSAVLARLLKKAGASVRVVMTEGAQAFITPLTLQALTGEEVRTSLLDPQAEAGMGHIELAKWADIVLIAPATADVMARLAAGMADDLLTTLCLATRARCLLAPAMNQAMWSHPASQRNAETLKAFGWQQLGPDAGEQACGDVGGGRMLEPEDIVAALDAALSGHSPAPGTLPLDATPEHDDHAPAPDAFMADDADPATGALAGQHVVITAGPTREAIDPVRYLSNHSSGKMGFALACAARDQGARVTLISGPVALATPEGVTRVDVVSAVEMLEAVNASLAECDIFIGCAAVADYRLAEVAEHKLKKVSGSPGLTLSLVENPDIIAAVTHRQSPPFTVGFAAETRELARHAHDKLVRKRLDLIVANDVAAPGLGFGADDNAAVLYYLDPDQPDNPATSHTLSPRAKQDLARAIIDYMLPLYRGHQITRSPVCS
ncbi:bifunctional phosphopantothenoylcysteine decarboxylase/phosphopantothenate--cysteine ligase CoaBC [Kushneria marisflavi]|uniref:Coenzyme A biosynthesis bifunctional protein CoaBC n=1 Tax=Kushneria marisflavi TaxID=157779 RepID=A0A240URS6_9GAMM|nr:bifunctional phosphopantothenoylcysteine decarboxylase/phosphopantothenate--cysteine ligase CoaBC [Kushneria marisflavi]ART63742.1 bifunctional 4'-phosphopantothenoylcysteine decarboxylase/phosphopantothenoylcysteine synthetase [Kushneria marisflavi]RKD85427.1 phosphopantothenoylcysteine decarboxylase/phosphopantothenate--cysteine ligase [Kushneria marisflavi]